MKHKYRIISLILAIVLIIFSTVFVLLNSGKATYYLDTYTSGIGDKEIVIRNIEFDNKGIVKFDEHIEDEGVHVLVFSAVKKGYTPVFIEYSPKGSEDLYYDYFTLQVHSFKVITINGFFGNMQGGWIFALSLLVYLIYLIIILILTIRKRDKTNLYSYTTAFLRGILIFSVIATAILIYGLTAFYFSLKHITTSTVFSALSSIPSYFTIIMLICFIPFMIMVIISNISLIIHEGKSVKNLLGIILSLFIIGVTVLLPVFNQYLYYVILYNMEFEHPETFFHIYLYFEAFLTSIFAYFECMLLGVIISSYKSVKYKVKPNKDFLIILGCGINEDGTLPPLLKGRVDKAIDFMKYQKSSTDKDLVFVPSGGQGDDEIISEAEAIKRYLLSSGIEKEKIITENKSRTTMENLRFSRKLIYDIKENAKVAFSTTNYHVFRAGTFLKSAGLKASGMGAKTKWYFWPNAFIREFIAILVENRKAHMLFVLFAFIVFSLLSLLAYLSFVIH